MTDLRFTPIAPRSFGDATLDRLHDQLRRSDEAWRGARAVGLDYDTVRSLASEYVVDHYAYQRARWGRVRSRIRLADLLR